MYHPPLARAPAPARNSDFGRSDRTWMSLLGHLWRWVARGGVARGGDTLAGPVGAGFLWDTYGGPWGTPMVSLAISQPLPMRSAKTGRF